MKPFRSAKTFKEGLVRFTEKIKGLFKRKKREKVEKEKKKGNKWLERMGINTEVIKERAKTQAMMAMVMGNFNVNRLIYANLSETQLTEPTRFDLLKRDIRIWYHIKVIKAYEFINHPNTKEAVQ